MTGTQMGEWQDIPVTGRPIDVRVGCLFEFEEDRRLCERVYFDFSTILRQLGVAQLERQLEDEHGRAAN
jgi:predicted ester cyclase